MTSFPDRLLNLQENLTNWIVQGYIAENSTLFSLSWPKVLKYPLHFTLFKNQISDLSARPIVTLNKRVMETLTYKTFVSPIVDFKATIIYLSLPFTSCQANLLL